MFKKLKQFLLSLRQSKSLLLAKPLMEPGCAKDRSLEPYLHLPPGGVFYILPGEQDSMHADFYGQSDTSDIAHQKGCTSESTTKQILGQGCDHSC